MRHLPLLLVGLGAVALGCGGAETPAKTPDTNKTAAAEPETAEREEPAAPIVTAEIGGLPGDGVASTFRRAEDKIFKCFSKGVRRVPFMGGAVRFWVKVDQKGKFLHAHLERSDLGDRATEQCLLDVLMGYTWPTPVGGLVGVATFEMSFEHAPDITPPIEWPADKASEVAAALAEELEECKFGIEGKFIATVYVKKELVEPSQEGQPREIGKAITASATPPNEAGEMAIDCIAGVLKNATYPSPGDTPAKVTFEL